ncbi:hypothetical protein PAPYR_7444 [Paratrimastix pyriformis]|uniref:Uncharacterized protein n=1 Tax=Paratrimastix pyriformis TaxID=342808 RepID=A0ABQ8UCZ7_9EUKA|nr:hypothetical protein PAPYR_7444 [Paratrimastix pyriformis]
MELEWQLVQLDIETSSCPLPSVAQHGVLADQRALLLDNPKAKPPTPPPPLITGFPDPRRRPSAPLGPSGDESESESESDSPDEEEVPSTGGAASPAAGDPGVGGAARLVNMAIMVEYVDPSEVPPVPPAPRLGLAVAPPSPECAPAPMADLPAADPPGQPPVEGECSQHIPGSPSAPGGPGASRGSRVLVEDMAGQLIHQQDAPTRRVLPAPAPTPASATNGAMGADQGDEWVVAYAPPCAPPPRLEPPVAPPPRSEVAVPASAPSAPPGPSALSVPPGPGSGEGTAPTLFLPPPPPLRPPLRLDRPLRAPRPSRCPP